MFPHQSPGSPPATAGQQEARHPRAPMLLYLRRVHPLLLDDSQGGLCPNQPS